MRLRYVMATLVVVSLLTVRLPAEQEAEPTAKEIIDAFINALGGVMVMSEKDSITIDGSMTTSMRGRLAADGSSTSDFKFQYKAGRLLVQMQLLSPTSPTLFDAAHGFDGETWWRRDRDGKKREASSQDRIWTQAIMYDPRQVLWWQNAGLKIKKLEDEKFGDVSAYHLSFEFGDELVAHQYFDRSTGLLLGSRIPADFQSEYKVTYAYTETNRRPRIDVIEIDGAPIGIEDAEGVQLEIDLRIEIDRIDFESEIDDAVFRGPEG